MGEVKIPTVGRIVHYFEEEGKPQAAIVTDGGDLAPCLNVFTKYGGVMVKNSVSHKSSLEGVKREDGGFIPYWDWPPIV